MANPLQTLRARLQRWIELETALDRDPIEALDRRVRRLEDLAGVSAPAVERAAAAGEPAVLERGGHRRTPLQVLRDLFQDMSR